MTLYVHWVRHGEVASHRGDIPVTAPGLVVARERGLRLGEQVEAGEEIHFLHTRTRRTLQTAEAIRDGLAEAVSRRGTPGVDLRPPRLAEAIRNPDVYLGGLRVEMVSTPEAMAEQTGAVGLDPAALATVAFWPEFWASRDRIGYWLACLEPPGEDARAVARRLWAYALSLRQIPHRRPQRYVCVTHSGPMRAFLRTYLHGFDPGEPNFSEGIDLRFPAHGPGEVAFRGQSAPLAGG